MKLPRFSLARRWRYLYPDQPNSPRAI